MLKHYSIILLLIYTSIKVIAQGNVTLNFKSSSLQKVEGDLYLLVFSNEDYFPKQAQNAILKLKQPFTTTLVLQALPYGTYAITFFIDKNKNGVLDTNFLGIPTEYFGFSNNKLGLMGPPSFQQAKFQHQSEQTVLSLELK